VYAAGGSLFETLMYNFVLSDGRYAPGPASWEAPADPVRVA